MTTTTNLINELVYIITGTSNPKANMVQGAVDQEEETMGMAADAFEMGRIDQAAVIAQYHWYWDRGLNLEDLDKEEAIADMLEACRQQRAQHNRKLGQFIPSQGCYWKHTKAAADNKKRLDKMLFEVKASIKALDASFVTEEDQFELAARYSTSEANLNYISDNVDKWDLGQCAFALDRLAELKATKEIFGKDYNTAKGLLLRKLAFYTEETYWVEKVSRWGKDYAIEVNTDWQNDLNTCIEIHIDSDIKAPGYDDRFYGEMSFDMESVIDMRRHQPHLTIDEAIYCVKSAQEDPEFFTPDMEL
jgi:hypothetical protein